MSESFQVDPQTISWAKEYVETLNVEEAFAFLGSIVTGIATSIPQRLAADGWSDESLTSAINTSTVWANIGVLLARRMATLGVAVDFSALDSMNTFLGTLTDKVNAEGRGPA